MPPAKQMLIWKAQDGDVRICDMSDDHLSSAMNYILVRRSMYAGHHVAAMEAMENEHERRTALGINQPERLQPKVRKPKKPSKPKRVRRPKMSDLLKNLESEDRTALFVRKPAPKRRPKKERRVWNGRRYISISDRYF